MQRLLKTLFLFIPGILMNTSVNAQFFLKKDYPTDYFAWPIEAPKALSANFGELRPNHFHMGFDCRTGKKQNLLVLAAADGYVARVKIESFGFGRSIYINHPNGFTTIYAHLNEFFPGLEKYVKEQQYKLKSWNVDLAIPDKLFIVKKEMFIAYSGNTGGSQGPHLHFEIRDTKTDKALNPGLFGFSIPDTIPPDIFRLAVYDRRLSTYEQTPKLYRIKKINGIYMTLPALIITNTDKMSFGIVTSDRSSGTANRNGIYETILYDNENPVIGFDLDGIRYEETRYLNAHIDYSLKSNGGPYVQHLSVLPGYANSIYKPSNADGIIRLTDSSTHKIKIEVKDTDGNTAILGFEIKRDSNFMIPPKNNFPVPDNSNEFYPGIINIFENSSIFFFLPGNCLYDSVHFRYNEWPSKNGFPIYQLHDVSVPLHSYFPLTIKATATLPDKSDSNRMVIHRFANGKNDYVKASPVPNGKELGWYRALFRDFGSFQLMIDSIPPKIAPLGFKDGMNCSKQNHISFVVTDNTEEIKNFTATLDGNWLRFSNDKGRVFIYDFDEMCPPGPHELKIITEDQVGNITEKRYHFTR